MNYISNVMDKCRRTDSKKEEFDLKKQIRELDNQMNMFYELDEWKINS